MHERSPFGVRLWRLLTHRRPSRKRHVEDLAHQATVPPSELDAVIGGATPAPELVRRLAPALRIHAADLFVIAALEVPHDLASAWPTPSRDVGRLLGCAVSLNSAQFDRLVEFVRSMPSEPRGEPAPTDNYPAGAGSLLLRLARNRNIRPRNAELLRLVGDGPYVIDGPVHPESAKIAALAWDARHLDSDQLMRAERFARTLP